MGCVVILHLLLGDYIYIQKQNFHAFFLPVACVILTGSIGSKIQQIPIRGVVVLPLLVTLIFWKLEPSITTLEPGYHSWMTLHYILVLVLPVCVFMGILGAAQSIHIKDKKDKELSDRELHGDSK